MTDLALNATGLRKQFGEKMAVANLTLQVKRGEIFGFLGPNGAGKTTSVKMLLGLITPTAGSATLLGQPLGDRATRAKIGFLPEHFRFHEWLKAAEFLDLHGRLHQMPKQTRQQTIPELLELVGLQDRAQTPLSAFSKGMLQRIGLAQALLNDPELVFLDEPTSGLDPLGRRLVRNVINQLRQRGTAVFLNSHLLSEVEQTCDRVTFIRQGEVLETISLHEIETAVPVTIRVGQPNEQLLADLAQFGNEVALVDGRIHLTLPDEETLPKLAHWLTSQGHTLYELTPQPVTLEERFLQIVGDQSEG
ncbi:MAG: ABC transporter ATP-binding protein [Ardenticatenaceae bacterium]|nr:ABC transporter ATP-binding protein [Anaerolineales bacterium]MCB8938380.1 ABC transporter ATP-binding protein [Ardenticatenaceae bacterium]MCB8975310.1 ABC transporter ATP-binding protein [Ardenticatenaceae bacterium]